MTALENYIHQNFTISLEDSRKVAGLFKPETVGKGKYFSQSGKYCNKLSFVQDGILRVYANLQDKEVTQWISTRNSFVTDFNSFFYRNSTRFSIQALTDTNLLTINHEQYMLMGTIIPEWNKFEKLFIGKCFVTMENRVFDLISMSAEERYNRLFHQNSELFNQVPLQYIASMLGMTPETLSRIRKKTA